MTARAWSILDAMRGTALFAGMVGDPCTWQAWEAFLSSFHGLPLDADGLELFRRHTGRRWPRRGGYPEAAVVVGRQSGKTQVAALVGVYEAAQALLAGERGVYVPLVAQDLRGAQRALYRYAVDAVKGSDLLAREVTRETSTEIELGGAVTLAVYPCRPAGLRGVRAAFCAIDELAFFVATDGRPTDVEMLRAARPLLATTGGRLLVLSSPYSESGALYDLHRRHYGRDDSDTLVWQATAPDMNPTLPEDYLRRMERDDPEAYRSEVLGEFRAGLSTFLDPDALRDVIAAGVRERQPAQGIEHVAYADVASGSGKDAFALAIAHADGERAVLDVCRAWRPPFDPLAVIAEAAALLKRYRVLDVRGDRYAPGFVSSSFRQAGIDYRASDRTTSEHYLELLPLVNAGAVVLLDEPALLRELRGLERRRGTAGRDKVDHRPGSHDDRAVACAGALVLAAGEDARGGQMLLGGPGGSYGTTRAELAEAQAELDELRAAIGILR